MEQLQTESERSSGDARPPHTMVVRLIALAIIVTGVLLGIHMFLRIPGMVVQAAGEGVKIVDQGLGVLEKHFGSKDVFRAFFGPIVSEQRLRRLQFFQRDQVCLFRIVRYRGKDGANHDHTESFKKEMDKKDLGPEMGLGSQYCEWQAKGTFEFSFFVDMSDLSKWNVKCDAKTSVLTLYPPDIGANTPAELEPLAYECKADSITIDEDYTKQQLEKQIPELKIRLANDQKQFMYIEAKEAIVGYYQDMFRSIPELAANPPKHIVVLFPHETTGQGSTGATGRN